MRTSTIEKALLAAAVLGVGYMIGKNAQAATAPPSNRGGGLLPPIPNPQPQPQPAPTPVVPQIPTDPAQLGAFAQQLLAQAAANPASVTPDLLNRTANALDAQGMTAQAAALRAVAATLPPATTAPRIVPLSLGRVAVPFSSATGRLPLEMAEQVRIANMSNNPIALRRIADRIETLSPGAFASDVIALRQRAAALGG